MNKQLVSGIIILLVVGLIGFLAYKMTGQNSGDNQSINYADGIQRKYTVQNTSFSLTHPKSIVALGLDSLPWGGQLPPNNDTSGMITTYCIKGRKPSMNDPYIQVAYVNKKMPSFSTPDSALTWLEKNVTQVSETRVLKPRFTVKTSNSRDVRCEEIYWGKRPFNGGFIEGKYVAYAYMDYSPKFLLTFVLTSKNSEDFQNVLKDYYYIIKSFK